MGGLLLWENLLWRGRHITQAQRNHNFPLQNIGYCLLNGYRRVHRLTVSTKWDRIAATPKGNFYTYIPTSVTWPKTRALASTLSSVRDATGVHSDTQDEKRFREGLDPYDEKMLNELVNYKENYGDCHVPGGKGQFSQEERNRLGVSNELSDWVYRQRSRYRRHRSSVEGIKQGKASSQYFQTLIIVLKSMGFLWTEREAQWQRSFNRLEAYKAKYGTPEVDRSKDLQLWSWTDQQRKIYQKGKMPQDRSTLLKEIGFVFDLHEEKWLENYNKLCRYKEENGHTRFPTHSEDDPSFGGWIARQRRIYQAGEMSQDRIEALEKIGFSWDMHLDAWETMYQELVKFYEKHGHTRVPRSEGSLWHWVDRQRRQLKKRLDNSATADDLEQIAALDKVEFKWAEDPDDERASRLLQLQLKVLVYDENWMEHFKELCAFKENFGHTSIPLKSPDYKELSAWVCHQRFLYKRNKLSEERIAALEGIDFRWTAQVARWDRFYQELVRFHAEHGHTRIPARNAELFRWTNQQRKALRSIAYEDRLSGSEFDRRMLALEKILED